MKKKELLLSYNLIYFPHIYFPDFHEEDFDQAILEYTKRDRRFGGIKNEGKSTSNCSFNAGT